MAGKRRVSRTRPEMILDAAKELFYARSFAAVGVDEIGARAGVTGPAIYRHFRGKDEILSTLFDDAIDRLFEATAIVCDDPWDQLDGLVRGHVSVIVAERHLAGVFIREGRSLAEPYRSGLLARERAYVERWTECLARCHPGCELEQLRTGAQVTLGGLNSVATWPDEELSGSDVPDVIARMVLGSVRALDPAATATER